MEYSLYAIYYVIKSYINLLMQLKVIGDVTVGGIIIAVIIVGFVLYEIGLAHSYKQAQEIYNRKVDNMGQRESDRRYREASRAYDKTR